VWISSPLSNVQMPAQMHAAHPTGFIEMGEGPFQALAPQPQQAQAARAANATTIPVDRATRVAVVLPVSASPIGFRGAASETDGFKVDERLIAVIALVADDFLEAVAIGLHGLDLLGRLNQRLDARLRVAVAASGTVTPTIAPVSRSLWLFDFVRLLRGRG
jgi:hypothetical protein